MLRKDLSTEEYRVYVNLCKDNRYRALKVYSDGRKENVSYPRIIVEKSIGRPLLPTEDVHHIDENPKNNDLSNLEVVDHVKHCTDHRLEKSPYKTFGDKIRVSCFMCGKSFTITKRQLREKVESVRCKHISSYFFCSRECRGKYGTMIQNSRKIEPIGGDISRDPCELGELFSNDNT